MKQNYIKPETEIIELDTSDIMLSESGGQIDDTLAKDCNNFYIDDFDDTDDRSYSWDNDYNKSIFEEQLVIGQLVFCFPMFFNNQVWGNHERHGLQPRSTEVRSPFFIFSTYIFAISQ